MSATKAMWSPVISNATDVEGLTDTTYFTVTGAATNGTAVIDAETGAWTFTPTDANWFGSDNFTVTVTDDLGGTDHPSHRQYHACSMSMTHADRSPAISAYVGNEGDAVAGDLNATDVEGSDRHDLLHGNS